MCALSLAAVVASERIYWYWAGIDADSLSVLTVYYAVAIAVAVTALVHAPGTGRRRVVLGGAVFALVVEGIITPVIYEDGPLPVLFLMFVGWHGVLGFVGVVWLLRRWALDGRSLRIAFGASVVGVGWGVWALASAVTDRVTAEEFAAEGAGSSDVLVPIDFASYAAWVGVALIAAHMAADRLWPASGWLPSRSGKVSTFVAAGALAALHVVPAVPWAPIKLGAIGFVLWRLLARTSEPAAGHTVIDALGGRIRYRHLLPIVLLPATAALTYAALWPLRDGDLMTGLYVGIIGIQVLAGIVALVWATRRGDLGAAAVVADSQLSSRASRGPAV